MVYEAIQRVRVREREIERDRATRKKKGKDKTSVRTGKKMEVSKTRRV